MSTSFSQASDLNERAEKLPKKGKQDEALALFQQVFLNFGKSNDDVVRAQVARALYFAATCNRELGKSDLADQIDRTLQTRFNNDTNPRARYWAELAQGKVFATLPDEEKEVDESHEEQANPELDKFLDELLTTKCTDLPPTEQPRTGQSTLAATSSSHLNETMPAFIRENEVTLERLHQIFQAAFMDSEFSGEKLWVEANEVKIYLELRPEHKIVQLASIWGLHRYAEEEEKLELANRINRNFIFVRAAINDADTLIIDCPHSYAFGMFPHQIVHAARLLGRVARGAIQESDESGLLS